MRALIHSDALDEIAHGPHRARHKPRTAASGAVPDGPEARFLLESHAACVSMLDRAAAVGASPRHWLASTAVCTRSVPGPGSSASTTSCRGIASTSIPSRSHSGSSPTANTWSSCRTAATSDRNTGSPTAGRWFSRSRGDTRCTGRTRSTRSSRWLAAAPSPLAAGLPRQLLRGRRLCALGRCAAADRGRVGSRIAGTGPTAGNFLESRPAHPARLRCPGLRLQQMFGDVWEWTSSAYSPIPASGRSPAPSANTTASSWRTSTCCAAALAPRRSHIRRDLSQLLLPHQRWQFSGIRLAGNV